MESIYVSIKNPTMRQRFLVISINIMLWLAIHFFKDEKKKMDAEIKSVLKMFYSNI